MRPGRTFYKMTGSGNDFVFFDARTEPAGALEDAETIRRLCARGTGIGADGVVFIEPAADADFAIRYLNNDGSLASLCGNASLCSVRLARELGIGGGGKVAFQTGDGVVHGRFENGRPEIDLQTARGVIDAFPAARKPGERRIGFALVGVPHLVVLCDDVERVPVVERGRVLRHHEALDAGANVNFVSRDGTEWRIRTYERGVEGETLACGTGAVATAVLLRAWGLSGERTVLQTRSGEPLEVKLRRDGGHEVPALSGEGRLVFRGELPGA